MDGWMVDGWMDRWMDRRMVRWGMDGRMVDGWMDRWIDGWIDRWMVRWGMDGWLGGGYLRFIGPRLSSLFPQQYLAALENNLRVTGLYSTHKQKPLASQKSGHDSRTS